MITAAVLVNEPGSTQDAAGWVQDARRASAGDLLDLLARQPHISRLAVVSPTFDDLDLPSGTITMASEPGPIHVGRCLASVVEQTSAKRLAYFGGGSAPLLSAAALEEALAWLAAAETGVLTNNRHASDWAMVAPAATIGEWQERLPLDNMLGWVLSAEAGLPVRALPAEAATRLDVDTPTDLLTLSLHGGTGPRLRRYLDGLPLDTTTLRQAIAVLAQPAGQVFLAGRIGPDAWLALNRKSQCWLRVIAEERGMVSSGRLARGEVYSFLADFIDRLGIAAFFAKLAEQSQAALIDTRVMLAHQGQWPSDADRYASDLGLVDHIRDPWLREFTAAAAAAPIPVVMGGQGLLAGDLFAISDLL
jgi:hypothetical protein